jgi:uncharacterized protein YaeQ
MAISSQLYRFKIELSDITRSVYESLDFRVAQHPSESLDFLLTRVLAYALNFQEGLNFSAEGLHNPDDPCLRVPSTYGGDALIIEIGSPSAKKLHKSSKAASKVKVYTYKNPDNLMSDLKSETVHNLEQIDIFSLDPTFLDKLAATLGRENRWNLTHNEGTLVLDTGKDTLQTELFSHR